MSKTEAEKRATHKWQTKKVSQYKEWKSKQSCLICSESEYCTLDLHHIDPSKKDFAIGSMVFNRSWSSILEEISKCVVLCSNCHRKVHAGVIKLQ